MMAYKCKMCGGDLEIQEGMTVAECEYCGTKQTVPTADNEKKMTLFQRANRLRFACEFDKAAGIYETIVAEFPEEAEAYWGLVLCTYGIEYVDDPATGKKIPTCHRSSFESVMEDSNFEQALENADMIARGVYREEAKQIEEIRKGIIEVSGKEEPYDIFICYKETDVNGERTIDSVIAQDISTELTEKGYRVFFARITLEDKLGQEYEPYIFAALNSAKIMLAFGTDYEYYNAVWVKNEWSRFLKLIAQGQKKTLIPCYKGIDAYDMPKEFTKLQAQDMGKVGATQDLLRGIEKILPKKEAVKETVREIVTEKVVVKGNAAHASTPNFSPRRKVVQDGITYVLQKDNTYWVTDHKRENYTENIIIELSIDGLRVTAIGDNSFKNGEFYSIDLPDSIIAIGESAFDGCKYLSSITIPDSVTSIGQHAFYRCENLASVTIPTSVTRIEEGSFSSCKSLTSITLPNSVTSIGNAAFWGCKELASIVIPNSVTSIGEAAFEYCESLDTIVIPNSVTKIKNITFNGCKRLTSIVIPNGVISIGKHAFYGCESIASITIPNSVTSIGAAAFCECVNLSSVIIPNSVQVIEDSAFTQCRNIDVTQSLHFKYINNCLIDTNNKRLISGNDSSIIPADGSITSIGNGAFWACVNLNSVIIPDGVISIGDGAFGRCTSLASITIPDSVTSIGDRAFDRCTSLAAVTIPNGVTCIEEGLCEECEELKSVTIPNSVTSIGDMAFYGCEKLASIVIPNSVTSIGENAFGFCESLKNINIPDSVTSIGEGAFQRCSLKSISLPSSVMSIGEDAFDKSSKFTVYAYKGSFADKWANSNDFNVERQEKLDQEELKYQRQKKLAEENAAHDAEINIKIAKAAKDLKVQQAIYEENANKIFGAGRKLKRQARDEIQRLEALIENLQSQLILKKAKVGDYILFGTYMQDKNNSNKKDINWLVLDVKDGKALVLSKYALDCMKSSSGTWENSYVREWLNEDFLTTAFSTYERAIIPKMTVPADRDFIYKDADPGNATKDQIFLLSTTEVDKYLHYGTLCTPTDYAIGKGLYCSELEGRRICNWWIRTPGKKNLSPYNWGNGPFYSGSCDYCELGIRPALWIDLNLATFTETSSGILQCKPK